ncbi:DUF2092 domain-containing protein [Nonomuraea sp. NBC_01738]|uniref:LolA family protein n=1 Tax=Nonomuraea sp. NBC_01738 TaxID=2976003 RepID=UPI002E0D2728|nr:DUF2092 domain-containing protein [Nonomuraea sp. NBC_01738]
MRWAVPIAAATVIAAAVGTGPVIAAVSGEPVLPERTASQLLADAAAAVKKPGGPPAMSGTVRQTASLGLPALPDMGGATPLSLLSGSHEVKVWYGSRDRLRLAMPTQMSEANLIVNGDQTWYWDSGSNTATKISFKGGQNPADHPEAVPTPTGLTPDRAAEKVLDQMGEHTAVSVSNTDEVAGRAVYQLVLAPKDAGSLVQEVRIALDGETYVPLRVQVFAKGSAEPAFEVGFSQVTFTPPADENFAFTPPAGATVKEKVFGDASAKDRAEAEKAKDALSSVKVVGDSWTSVAVLPMTTADLTGNGKDGESHGEVSPQQTIDAVLKSATPVSGTWGSGKLISTKLVTALITDDGRLLVGAVTPEEITKAAGVK